MITQRQLGKVEEDSIPIDDNESQVSLDSRDKKMSKQNIGKPRTPGPVNEASEEFPAEPYFASDEEAKLLPRKK